MCTQTSMVQGAEKLGRANSHSRTGQLPCQGCDLWSSSPLAIGASAREASKQKGLKSAPRPPHSALAVGLRGSPDRRVLLSSPTVHPREMASWSRPRGILTPAGSFGALARAQKGKVMSTQCGGVSGPFATPRAEMCSIGRKSVALKDGPM